MFAAPVSVMLALPLAAPKHGDAETRLLAEAAVGHVEGAFIVKLTGFTVLVWANTKFEFAKEIVTRFHDASCALRAHHAFTERFQQKVLPDDLETQIIEVSDQASISQVLKNSGLTGSTSEAMRLVRQGAVKINSERVEDSSVLLALNTPYIIQVGKQRLAKVVLSKN